MISVGTDMVEISRIKKSMRNKKFLKFILGSKEYSQLQSKNFLSQSVAVNFCAKEAFLKSIGVGIFKFDIRNIEILRDDMGKPYIHLSGKALEFTENLNFSISLTHTKQYASAVVICFPKQLEGVGDYSV